MTPSAFATLRTRQIHKSMTKCTFPEMPWLLAAAIATVVVVILTSGGPA